MGLLRVCDEELGLVGIWARISHRHDAAGVKLGTKEDQDGRTMDEKVEKGTDFESGSDLIRKWGTPNALTTFTRSSWITRLNHESPDVAVENTTIVIIGCAKSKKVLDFVVSSLHGEL